MFVSSLLTGKWWKHFWIYTYITWMKSYYFYFVILLFCSLLIILQNCYVGHNLYVIVRHRSVIMAVYIRHGRMSLLQAIPCMWAFLLQIHVGSFYLDSALSKWVLDKVLRICSQSQFTPSIYYHGFLISIKHALISSIILWWGGVTQALSNRREWYKKVLCIINVMKGYNHMERIL